MPNPPRKTAASSALSRSAKAPGDAVTALLDGVAHPQRALIDAMRAAIQVAVPTAIESIKWNAPSFATAEHFATFHLRGKQGVQLILHLGAKPRPGVDMRILVPDLGHIAEWKGPDRAVVSVRDEAHFGEIRSAITRLIAAWQSHVA